jgi:hypothetical protein
MSSQEIFLEAFDRVMDQLEKRPHPTIPGLRERYYYRGAWVLPEHLTPKGLAWNIARFRGRGELEHAALLERTWKDTRARKARR